MVSATVIKNNIVDQVSPLFTHGIATFTTSADSDLTAKEKQEGISALFDAITMID